MNNELHIGEKYSNQDVNDPFPPHSSDHIVATIIDLKQGWVLFNRGKLDSQARLEASIFRLAYPKKV